MSTLRKGFGNGLRQIRKARDLSQEDFSDVSSRTYLSSLERGTKSPTLDKLEQLAGVLRVHPLTLFAAAYVHRKGDLEKLLETVRQQVNEITG